MALSSEEFEGKTVRSLKTLVAKKIGVPRFRQRWLSEDHIELKDEDFATASDVQLLVLEFVQAEDGDVRKLFAACHANNVDRVDELLRKPLNPDVRPFLWCAGKAASHEAAGSGHFQCLALLLEAGADKDLADDCFERTALHVAAQYCNLEAVRLLLEAGADKDKADCEGKTALHLAALTGHQDVVKLLLQANANRDARDPERRTALHLAAALGQAEVVKLLLEAGADKDVVDSSGQTALHVAAENHHIEVVQLLKADLEQRVCGRLQKVP